MTRRSGPVASSSRPAGSPAAGWSGMPTGGSSRRSSACRWRRRRSSAGWRRRRSTPAGIRWSGPASAPTMTLRPIDPRTARVVLDNVAIAGSLLAGQRYLAASAAATASRSRAGSGPRPSSARPSAKARGRPAEARRGACSRWHRIGVAMTIAAARRRGVGASRRRTVGRRLPQVQRLQHRLPGGPGHGPRSRVRSTSGRRPSGSASRRCCRTQGGPARTSHSPDATVDWCSGCGLCTMRVPGGREDRRDEQPRPRPAAGRPPARGSATGCSARPISSGGSASPTAPLANWSLRNRLFRALIEVVRRHPPHGAAAGLRPPDVPIALAQSVAATARADDAGAAAGSGRRATSTAAPRTTTSPTSRSPRSTSSDGTASRRSCPSRSAAACR